MAKSISNQNVTAGLIKLGALSPSKAWANFRVLTAKLGCRSNKKSTEQTPNSLHRVSSIEPEVPEVTVLLLQIPRTDLAYFGGNHEVKGM